MKIVSFLLLIAAVMLGGCGGGKGGFPSDSAFKSSTAIQTVSSTQFSTGGGENLPSSSASQTNSQGSLESASSTSLSGNSSSLPSGGGELPTSASSALSSPSGAPSSTSNALSSLSFKC